jgi:cell cycle arrest protein BUB3
LTVKLLDIPTTTITKIGTHMAAAADKVAVSCLHSLEGDNANLVASAGWHKQFHLWDIRQPSSICTLDLPGKAFAMDYDSAHQRLVVATAGRRTCFVDVRNQKAEISLDRESSLKFQTRCISFFPGGKSVALGSVEGRVGVEFLDELGLDGGGGKKYAFKCHRVNDTVYPVNCLAFHPKFHGTFATGGCDGTVVLWDGLHKKKLTSLPSFPTSISAMTFNHDGTQMAIAASYTYEEGDREHPRDEIYIRQMLDSECMPKTK